MTYDEFDFQMTAAVRNERRAHTVVLELINLAQDRKFYLERGFSSLFDWLVRGYGYSESAAYRRVEAARLLRVVPGVSDKIESGEVSLTNLAKAHSAIRAQEKMTGQKLSADEQAQVVSAIENKTTDETASTLFQIFPESASSVHQERQTAVNETETRLSFNLDAETMENLEWVKAFLSHSIPDGETARVFARLLKEFRARNDKKDKSAAEKVHASHNICDSTEEKAHTPQNVHESARETSHVSSDVHTSAVEKPCVSKTAAKRVTLHTAERKCEFVDERTGRVCGATYMVEVDHIRPRAFGGEDKLENYRCLCRAHNQYEAERKLGEFQANLWRKSRAARFGNPG